MRYSFLLLVFICFSCQPKHDLPQILELQTNWQFKNVGDSLWQSATVPGNVHSDLLDHQLIADPFIGDNEKEAQWISKTDWEYKTTFALNEKTLQKQHIHLNFEGLDTYASVYLNDSLILKANNAFRVWNVDVKSLLTQDNELRLVFEHTSKYEDAEKEKLPYELPDGNRVFTRKAQFQYGWDWGPKLNTSGIWRPIKLEAWNTIKIENIYINQIQLKDSMASLVAEVEYHSKVNKDLVYGVYVNDSLVRQIEFNPSNYNPGIPFQIKNPKRWWPHNLGEPYLYTIKVIVKEDDKILDSMSLKKGLRTIELVTEKDAIGESFYFKVNDRPVYAKGANYIPQHSLQNKVTDAHYENLLSGVVNANMNMLRVWGGGVYENDLFYDLCDEKGLLVWQDFMFACAMYPGDETFLENVKQEAIDNVKRLSNHASMALWCGNNENSEGWHRWGWQAGRSTTEKEEIWGNYLKLFDTILPNVVAKYSDTDYWETSPKFGRGNPKYKTEGDAHDWWIWHDAYPFEHLEANVPRFMSEFGFQSYPSYETIKFINQNDSLEISSEGFKNHQKHSRGFELIKTYMERDFPSAKTVEDDVYLSQLLQAYGITKGIETQRRSKPYNMGTLYWQLNDCWPAVSWSSIDYFGNPKALQYKVKQCFANLLISSSVEHGILKTFAVNDHLNPIALDLEFKIIDFNGKVIMTDKVKDELKGNQNKSIFEIELSKIEFQPNKCVLVVSDASKSWLYYFSKLKDLALIEAPIEKIIRKTKDGFAIALTSKVLQKDVFLYTDERGVFSDNFFDLLPNTTEVIHFKTEAERLEHVALKTFNTLLR